MKIGLRTVKTAISAALAMIIAEKLGLLYAPSAGIISVLSVTSTKKTSVMTGIYRLLSLALATILAYICFTFLGFEFRFGNSLFSRKKSFLGDYWK